MQRRYVNTGAECDCGHGWRMFASPKPPQCPLCGGEGYEVIYAPVPYREPCACQGETPPDPGVCWHCAGGPLFCWKCDGEDKPLVGLMPFPAGIVGPLRPSGLCDRHEEDRLRKLSEGRAA